jgi:cytochrome P450
MMSFFLAVLLHPEIQTRAQKEIDAVTGGVRLPTFEDRPELPFVDAICKEVLRWRPVLPLGGSSISLRQPTARSGDFTIHSHALCSHGR